MSSLSTRSLLVGALLAGVAACRTAGGPGVTLASSSPPRNAAGQDARVGLKAGWFDAASAQWNLALVSNTRPSEKFFNATTPGDARLTNSDLAFTGNLVFQGNYSGWQVWDISNPRQPVLKTAYVCPGSQSDVTVYKNLLFVSAEATSGRTDCGLQGVQDTVSHDRARGIRIFDISDVMTPKSVAMVQTCRGSHTNTLVTDPKDPSNVYIYVSGSAGVRSPTELAGCSGAMPEEDANTALFRIEVIQVPVAHPEQAKIVSSPRIFDNLAAPARHAENAADIEAQRQRAAAAGRPQRPGGNARPGAGRGPTQCHDITAYPAIGLAGGACAGYGLLLDISDVAHPKRIGAVADSNFSFWHSATFSNDGSKVLFSDEWGGGTQPRCRATDRKEWGADAIFTLSGSTMSFKSYYKLPAAQTQNENCVAHNGSLVPVPGRDVMVQSWYQGGVSVFDWSDPSNPVEIAYFDRGPMDDTKPVGAGHWSAYWYNGYIVASEIARGLDVFELKPSALLSQNEIDAAKLVTLDHFNAQEQPKLAWPAHVLVAKAYLDQLARNNGLPAARRDAVAKALDAADKLSGSARQSAFATLAAQLDGDAKSATDAARVKAMAAVVRDLAR